ncbi:MAG: pitrilysin family protein [Pseudomonadota bacterium]|nr:pitrilysin family protein [Pseudomonadota bacterium]
MSEFSLFTKVRQFLVAILAILASSGFFLVPVSAGVFFPKTFELENGLKVVVIENHRAPIVVQMLWYRVGAADEAPGESGLAHFLEHLLFKGTKTTKPGEFSRTVTRIGGQDNAFTSHDYTAYFQRVASHEIETVMRLEADRMWNLRLTDAVVLPERDVILEERRTRTDNSPAAQLREQMRRSLYLNHPYGRPVIGWMSEIRKLTTASAIAFYRKHYAPNNAMLILAGDVTVEKVRQLANKYYRPIPPKVFTARARPQEPPHRMARRVIFQDKRVRLPSWSRFYLAPSYSAGDRHHAHALEVLAQVLGGGSTSQLHRRLVVDRGIASTAGAWYHGNSRDYGEFGLYASPKLGGDIKVLERALGEELNRVLRVGFPLADIERAKKFIAAQAIFARDGLRAGPNAIGSSFAQGQAIKDVETWPNNISAVTSEQVIEAARAVLNKAGSVTGILLPEPTR